MSKRGRPNGRTKNPVAFRISKEANAHLIALKTKWGWSKVTTVERALAFANTHRDFSPLLCQPKTEVAA